MLLPPNKTQHRMEFVLENLGGGVVVVMHCGFVVKSDQSTSKSQSIKPRYVVEPQVCSFATPDVDVQIPTMCYFLNLIEEVPTL